jgi:AcrR family transcriptional regulator
VSGKTAQGLQTRRAILDAAARIGSVDGLEGVTLGRLASELDLSKSGLFAHFRSKEELQLATIEHVRQIYVQRVMIPGLSAPRGIATLYALLHHYLVLMEERAFPGGCFFASAMAEYDSRPGAVRDRVAAVQRQWLEALERAVRDGLQRGHLQPRGTAPDQLAFELEAAVLSANWYHHLFNDPTFFARARRAVRFALETRATARGRRELEALLATLG